MAILNVLAMIEAKPIETKINGSDGLKYTHITVVVTIRTEVTGVYQKHLPVYSGLDNEYAAAVRRDVGLPIV